jgi:site-specific DNA recombinase
MSADFLIDGMPLSAPADVEGYLRISSAEDALGVGRQRTELSGAFRADERAVRWTVENDRSAFRGKVRPGFRSMLERLDSPDGAAELWSWHSDRITRTPRELELLIDLVERRADTGRPLLVRTIVAGVIDLNTPGGRLAARIGVAVAANESEVKSERIRAKHRELRDAGRSAGGTRPYGYDVGGHAIRSEPISDEIAETEADVIRALVQRVQNSDVSISQLARELNERGVPSATGGRWHGQTLRGLLMNPRLAGLRTTTTHDRQTGRRHSRRVTGAAKWPAIITEADHRRVVAALNDPKRGGRHGKTPRLLTGLLVCSKCGARLVVTRRRGAPVYSCDRLTYDRRGCRSLSIQAEPVERIVTAALLAYAETIETVDETDTASVDATAELIEIETERDRIGALVVSTDPDERLSPRAAAAAERALDERQRAAEAALRSSDRRSRVAALSGLQGALSVSWHAQPERQRTWASELIERVVIAPHDPAVRGFDESRIGEPVWRDPVKSDDADI